MNPDTIATIEKTAREFFEKLGLLGEIKVGEGQEQSVTIDVQIDNPQLYIGEHGQTLAEIQYALKALLRRQLQEQVYIVLDINEYRQNKEYYVRELARTGADEVVLLKTPKELPPMSAAERRIVHMELQNRQDVETKSVGEGAERRIQILFKEKIPAEGSDLGL